MKMQTQADYEKGDDNCDGDEEMYAFIYITFRPHPVVLKNIFALRNFVTCFLHIHTEIPTGRYCVHLPLYL